MKGTQPYLLHIENNKQEVIPQKDQKNASHIETGHALSSNDNANVRPKRSTT